MESPAAQDDLARRLRAWAGDSNGTLAGVELLIDQERWLQRPDFIAAAVTDGRIDWRRAFLFSTEAPGSAGELALLQFACSLAEAGITVPLSLVGRLDRHYLDLFHQALHTAKFGGR